MCFMCYNSSDSMAGALTWLTFCSALPVLPLPLAHLYTAYQNVY